MATLALYLLVLIAGMVSLAGLPLVVAVPLAVVLGAFALVSGVLLLAFALNVKGWRAVLGSPAVAL